MSETRQSSPSHPHLSTEIFFHILSLVPIDHILPFRTLCRAVRDEMNTRVLYSYIRRTKLLSFTVPNDIDDEFLESLNLRALSGGIATFSHLEPRFSNVPIWTRTHAVFRFDAEWIDAFRRLSNYDAAVIQHSLRIGSHPETNPAWFVQLDNAVLDLDFKPENRLQVTADPYNGDILITWRTMLRSFLVTETKLSSMIVQHTVQSTASSISSVEENCIRAILRERFRQVLGTEDADVPWFASMQPLLFDDSPLGVNSQRTHNENYSVELIRALRDLARRNIL